MVYFAFSKRTAYSGEDKAPVAIRNTAKRAVTRKDFLRNMMPPPVGEFFSYIGEIFPCTNKVAFSIVKRVK
jgi:hypothetical protein